MSRLRQHAGFTLVEMLIATTLTLVVITAGLSVVDQATRGTRDSQLREEATQEGRRAFDRIVTRLHSQVCVGDLTSATATRPFAEATGTKATFYADTSDAAPTRIPTRYTIELNTTTNQLTETLVQGIGTPESPAWTSTPVVRLLANRIVQVPGTPLLRYYGYTTPAPGTAATATVALNDANGSAVSTTNLSQISRVVITGQALPDSRVPARQQQLATNLQNEVYVRLSDPNENPATPQCI